MGLCTAASASSLHDGCGRPALPSVSLLQYVGLLLVALAAAWVKALLSATAALAKLAEHPLLLLSCSGGSDQPMSPRSCSTGRPRHVPIQHIAFTEIRCLLPKMWSNACCGSHFDACVWALHAKAVVNLKLLPAQAIRWLMWWFGFARVCCRQHMRSALAGAAVGLNIAASTST